METLIASGIELGLGPEPRAPLARAGAIQEIGPYDLPEPPGGWVDLVLDDEDAAARDGAAAPRAASPAIAEPAARSAAPSLAAPRERRRPEHASAPTASRWFLFPEALVVGGFLAFGALFLAAVILLRSPREPPAPREALSAPVEVTDPAGHAASRRAARGAPPRAARGTAPGPAGEAQAMPPAAPVEPIAPDSPVDPESPPSPNLAPWGGAG
jgi:hypothetical protein